jgi:hypothetical protein
MGESRFDEAVQTAWGMFEERLDQRLAELGDGPLVIGVEAETAGSGTTPYVQFVGSGDRVRGEVSSNRFLDGACKLDRVQKRTLEALGWRRPDDDHPNWWVEVERGELEVLRTMAVDALRSALGVVHPRFLRWDDVDAVDADDAADGELLEHELGFPSTSEELQALTDATVKEYLELDHEVCHDKDGDIPIAGAKVPVWIRVREDSALVQVFSHVVVNVLNNRQARIEVDILNRAHRQLKFTVEGRTVVATIDLPGSPYVAQHLRDAIDLARETLVVLADDLALRTGGRLFFAPPRARRRAPEREDS